MPISEINRTDAQDNATVSIGESGSTNLAQVALKTTGSYGLHVISEMPSISSVPLNKTIHLPEYLKNGASANQNVNGSVTPVNFDYVVPVGQTWYVDAARVYMEDSGSEDAGDFGVIGGIFGTSGNFNTGTLTNGWQWQVIISGTTYTIGNFMNNSQLAIFFEFNPMDSAAGFLNNNDILMGTKRFAPAITLAAGDTFRVRVRDNLSTIQSLGVLLNKWRTI